MVKAILIDHSNRKYASPYLLALSFFNLLGSSVKSSRFNLYLLKAVVEGQIGYAFRLLDSSNQKFSKVFYDNQTPMLITRLADGLIIEINYQLIKEFGFGSEELIGQKITEKMWLSPGERQKFIQEVLTSGIVRDKEYVFKRRNGELCNVILSATQIEIAQETCILSSFKDITKHKKVEAALLQSQKTFQSIVQQHSFAYGNYGS